LEAIRQRLAECGLELHSEKTRIVYCKDANRKLRYDSVAFDFLGYTFQPRRARNRKGRNFVSFLPAISANAARLRRRKTASIHWLGRLAERAPNLLVLWQLGITPSAGR
jgi:RNA-directed DNA polymerase